jgi:hypothetical protein
MEMARLIASSCGSRSLLEKSTSKKRIERERTETVVRMSYS